MDLLCIWQRTYVVRFVAPSTYLDASNVRHKLYFWRLRFQRSKTTDIALEVNLNDCAQCVYDVNRIGIASQLACLAFNCLRCSCVLNIFGFEQNIRTCAPATSSKLIHFSFRFYFAISFSLSRMIYCRDSIDHTPSPTPLSDCNFSVFSCCRQLINFFAKKLFTDRNILNELKIFFFSIFCACDGDLGLDTHHTRRTQIYAQKCSSLINTFQQFMILIKMPSNLCTCIIAGI